MFQSTKMSLLLGLFYTGVIMAQTNSTNSTDTENEAPVQDTTDAFVTSLIVNIAIGAVLLLLFCILRPKYAWCYEPKLDAAKRGPGLAQPPAIGAGFLAWIKATTSPNQDTLLRSAGLDGVMLVQFYSIGLKFFGGAAILGLAILVALNATGDNGVEGFDALSMANVKDGDRLWGHVICAYIMAFWAYFLLNKGYLTYVALRHRVITRDNQAKRSLTLMVQNVPQHLQSEQAFNDFWQNLYPDTFHEAYLARNLTKLDKLVTKADKTANQLAGAQYIAETKGEPPLAKTKMCCGQKVDAITLYKDRLREYNEEIIALQAEAREGPVQAAGFVTFKTARAAASAVSQQHVAQLETLDVRLAPEPRDVFWPNLKHTQRSRNIREPLVAVAVYALVFFWAIPVAFVSSLTTMQALSDLIPFLAFVVDLDPALRGFLEGFLPSLALIIFMALLPPILLAMSKVQGVEAHSWLQVSVFQKLYLFQIFNVFLVSTLAGGLFASLDKLSDIGSIVDLLAESIPKVSTFFINYIMLKTFVGFALQMSRLVPLLIGGIKKKWLCKTPLDIKNAEAPPSENYGTLYPSHLLIFTIGATYSVISPLVLPFAFIYFALGWLVTRYQHLYVVVPEYESGGQCWPKVFGRCFVGLIIGQVTLIGLLALNQVPIQTGFVVPLPCISYFIYTRLNKLYSEKARALPVELQASADAEEGPIVENQGQAKQDVGLLNVAGAVQVGPFPSFVQRSLVADFAGQHDEEEGGNGDMDV